MSDEAIEAHEKWVNQLEAKDKEIARLFAANKSMYAELDLALAACAAKDAALKAWPGWSMTLAASLLDRLRAYEEVENAARDLYCHGDTHANWHALGEALDRVKAGKEGEEASELPAKGGTK